MVSSFPALNHHARVGHPYLSLPASASPACSTCHRCPKWNYSASQGGLGLKQIIQIQEIWDLVTPFVICSKKYLVFYIYGRFQIVEKCHIFSCKPMLCQIAYYLISAVARFRSTLVWFRFWAMNRESRDTQSTNSPTKWSPKHR